MSHPWPKGENVHHWAAEHVSLRDVVCGSCKTFDRESRENMWFASYDPATYDPVLDDEVEERFLCDSCMQNCDHISWHPRHGDRRLIVAWKVAPTWDVDSWLAYRIVEDEDEMHYKVTLLKDTFEELPPIVRLAT